MTGDLTESIARCHRRRPRPQATIRRQAVAEPADSVLKGRVLAQRWGLGPEAWALLDPRPLEVAFHGMSDEVGHLAVLVRHELDHRAAELKHRR